MAESTGEAIHAIDYEARGLAREAATLIASHERICTERWDQLRKSINERREEAKIDAAEVKAQISALFRHLWIAAGGVISVLIGLSAFLAQHPIIKP